MTATEEMVWSYLLQIVAGMGAVHAVGLACRAALHPSKVLLLPGGRIRLGTLSNLAGFQGQMPVGIFLLYLHLTVPPWGPH